MSLPFGHPAVHSHDERHRRIDRTIVRILGENGIFICSREMRQILTTYLGTRSSVPDTLCRLVLIAREKSLRGQLKCYTRIFRDELWVFYELRGTFLINCIAARVCRPLSHRGCRNGVRKRGIESKGRNLQAHSAIQRGCVSSTNVLY